MTDENHWHQFRQTVYMMTAAASAAFLTAFSLMGGWNSEDLRQRLEIHNTASLATGAVVFATMSAFACKLENDREGYCWLTAPAAFVALTAICWLMGFHNLAASQNYSFLNQAAILAGAIGFQSVAAAVAVSIADGLGFSRAKTAVLLTCEGFLVAGAMLLPIVHLIFRPLMF